jgi:hypothetical protein
MTIRSQLMFKDAPNNISKITRQFDLVEKKVFGEGHTFPASQSFQQLQLCNPFNHKCRHPRNRPDSSRATAAAEPWSEFFDTVASTLILATPAGGGIHLGLLALLHDCCIFCGLIKHSSEINLSTKLWVESGLWKEFSSITFLLAYQIAHIVTTTRVISSCVRVDVSTESQLLASRS